MINVKNILTGEIFKVSSLRVLNGKIAAYHDFPEPSAKWCSKFPYCVKTDETETDEKHSVECRVFTLADGYELTKVRTSRPKPAAADVPAAQSEEPVIEALEDEAVEQPAEVANEPEVEPTHTVQTPAPAVAPAEAPGMNELTSAFTALTPLFSGVQKNVLDAVMLQLQPVIDKLNQQAATQVQHIHVHTPQGNVQEINEVVCSDFEEILAYLAQGVPVYMYGAAGCGKSHTARQLATALGLPFYESMQVMFAHDIKGYGDAGGNYQSTPFFKAFTEGGVFFLDEVDASAPEALVVLNTAIANRRFDFPIVGNVQAHPDFRVVAAGNTAMTGADIEYVARSVQDAATENRFSFFQMQYDRRVELPVCAQGDTELMSFITDLRQAIKAANIVKCVSYRQTTLLANKELLKFGRVKALRRNVFKGMEQDEIRIIYGYLTDTKNVWAKAMEELFESI